MFALISLDGELLGLIEESDLKEQMKILEEVDADYIVVKVETLQQLKEAINQQIRLATGLESW